MPHPKVEISGDSEAAVALALLQMIMDGEDETSPDRGWLLATYAQCLAVVQGDATIEIEDDEEDVPPGG